MKEHVSSKAGNSSYVLLTAAFNEEAYIQETIESVLAQETLPKVWVIVSDSSTDRTDEIVRRYAENHSFIRLIRRNKDQNRGFASKVFALRAGLQSISLETFQFIGHLDADISLEPSYFTVLLEKFEREPMLGLAGGWFSEKIGGEFQLSPGSHPGSVPGALQMFRRKCYEEIGGLLPIEYGGEDWYAEVMARKSGWQVRSFPELTVHHLRESGTANSSTRYCYHQGIADYSLGSHPVFEFAKLARRVTWRPYVIGALARLLGFIVAHFSGKRMVPPDFVAFLRKEQMARLWADSVALAKGVSD
jgi:glycosyltransferase involved in cell wall biosynthesis